MNLVRIDILGRKDDTRCIDCNDPFGTYFAMYGGISTEPLCFACIMKHIDQMDAVIA